MKNKLKPEKLYFSPNQGGVICKSCFKNEQFDIEIQAETVKIVRLILGNNIKIIPYLNIDKKYIKGLKEASDNYYSFILEISGQN